MAGGMKIVKQSITLEELKKKFPRKKASITDDTVDMINGLVNNPELEGNAFIDHLVTYQQAMIDQSASMREYINAIMFVSYLEVEKTAIEAYRKARIGDEFVATRVDAKPGSPDYDALANAAGRYRKNPLVRQILKQSEMPLYLMFQGSRYKAVAVLAREMESAPLARDRIAAADKLLANVKPPDSAQIELNIGLGSEAMSVQQQLFKQLAEVSRQQHARLVNGESIENVQQLGIEVEPEIIEGAVVDGKEEE